MSGRLNGKVALVTGAGSGLGAESARRLKQPDPAVEDVDFFRLGHGPTIQARPASLKGRASG